MGLRDNLKSEKAKERYDRNFNSVETTYSQKELEEHDKEIRTKAIDEFMKNVEGEYDNDACPGVTDWMDYKISIRDLFRIAEELKGGGVE